MPRPGSQTAPISQGERRRELDHTGPLGVPVRVHAGSANHAARNESKRQKPSLGQGAKDDDRRRGGRCPDVVGAAHQAASRKRAAWLRELVRASCLRGPARACPDNAKHAVRGESRGPIPPIGPAAKGGGKRLEDKSKNPNAEARALARAGARLCQSAPWRTRQKGAARRRSDRRRAVLRWDTRIGTQTGLSRCQPTGPAVAASRRDGRGPHLGQGKERKHPPSGAQAK